MNVSFQSPKNIIRYLRVKRIWESILVLFTVPLWLPISFLVASAIYIDTGRPVFFVQNRVGKGNRVFRMFKFRSMKVETEKVDLRYASDNDNRVTKVGKVIRKFRLDEIPQFFHVLTGEMALIGVRPEPKQFADQYTAENPLYFLRHTFRPGLTGWAQVEYGYAASAQDTMKKLEYDLYYVKNISFLLDMKILFKTVLVVLSGFGSR